MYRWILDPTDRYAVLAHVAIKKSETDYNVIVEISSTLSPEELLAVRRAYQLRYKHSLEEDLAAHTTGDIRKVYYLQMPFVCLDMLCCETVSQYHMIIDFTGGEHITSQIGELIRPTLRIVRLEKLLMVLLICGLWPMYSFWLLW